MIDFEKLKDLDMEVINSRPTEEEFRQISAFLKKHREEQAHLEAEAKPRNKTAVPLMAAKRKNIGATVRSHMG
jgi:hypothetical protein